MATYDSLYQCSIGSSSFQLEDYALREEPVVVEGPGLTGKRIGTKLTVRGKGWVEGATADAFNTALWAVKNAMAADGQNFKIYGPGGRVEVSILAARCIDRGPHIAFDVLEQTTAGLNRKLITFEVMAQTARVSSGGGGSEDAEGGEDDAGDTREMSVSVRPDGLRRITLTGEVRGPNVYDRFIRDYLGQFESQYPSTWWTKEHQYKINYAGDRLSYTATAVELRDQVPVGLMASAIDLEGVYTRERDEGNRLVERWEFNGLAGGDYESVIATMRASIPGDAVVLAESLAVTSYRERRFRLAMSTVRGMERDGVMQFTQTFRRQGAEDCYEVKQYPGVDPVLVRKPKGVGRLVQSGSMVAAGSWATAPGPVGEALLEAPEVVGSWINAIEKRIEWTYVIAVTDEQWPDWSRLGRDA